MPDYPYLIIGGGMAADAAVRGIRSVDSEGAVGLVSMEIDPPYNRPPLSKGVWKGRPVERIFRGTDQQPGTTLHLGRRITGIDLGHRVVTDDQGERYRFEKLLFATGGSPRRFSFGEGLIHYYRTLDDYRILRRQSDKGTSFVVIGGGFIGSEIAAVLAERGNPVTMVFPEAAVFGRTLPQDMAHWVTGYFREKGVDVRPGQAVIGAERVGEGVRISLRNAASGEVSTVTAGAAVAGLGLVPNTGLAEAAGMAVADGIVVDAAMRTSRADVFAAGDVASFFNPALGQRMRVEHEEAANETGFLAGAAMAGQPGRYEKLPLMYSDFFDLGYEGVGLLDARMQTAADWEDPYRRGFVYYLADGRVRGVLMMGMRGQADAARALIADPGPWTPESLVGRIPIPPARSPR